MDLEKRWVEALREQWRSKRVGVVGDLMLDRYVWGEASRISQEAPIPIVAVQEVTARPGGAANVLYNLRGLGAQAAAFGVVGDDAHGGELRTLLDGLDIDSAGIVSDGDRVTTEKTRIVAGHQQVVRVDTEQRHPLRAEVAKALETEIRDALAGGRLDALILEDYAKGVLGPELAQNIVRAANEAGVPVALDPHPANRLEVQGFTLMSPNHAEAFVMAGVYHTPPRYPLDRDPALHNVVNLIFRRWQVKHLLITLGAGGLALFRDDAPVLHVPTKAREVYDVSGAGDTVIAAYMLALLAGATPEEAATISNHAAGVVVGKLGTAPVHAEELVDSFD